MRLAKTLTAFATAIVVAAAFAVTAEARSTRTLTIKITTRIESPTRQMHTGKMQVRHATNVLRFLKNHPSSGTYRIHKRVRRNHLWLLHVGITNLAIAQRRLDAIATAKRAAAERVLAAAMADGAEFACIHRHEGSWTSDTGNGYYGGLQMDSGFMHTYGHDFMVRWGNADKWPVWAQVTAARRARDGYRGHERRGYSPWPNTAHTCGLL